MADDISDRDLLRKAKQARADTKRVLDHFRTVREEAESLKHESRRIRADVRAKRATRAAAQASEGQANRASKPRQLRSRI